MVSGIVRTSGNEHYNALGALTNEIVMLLTGQVSFGGGPVAVLLI